MRILFFGTFDERAHPRVRALREGLEARGHDIDVCNEPLGVSTAARVGIARNPLTAPVLAVRILRCWVSLWRRSRGVEPDVVVVGYLGHFDVHLARRRFRRATIVLDHLVSLGDTVRDRGLGDRSLVTRLLDRVDRAAIGAADVVLVDTIEQRDRLPRTPRTTCVVPVSVPAPWLAVEPEPAREAASPLRVVFFGLYTPLHGAPVVGQALARLAARADVEITMIGTGQDLDATRRAAAANPHVRWIDWVDIERLPAEVAMHHVCLGIFGTTDKAQRVVPNKVLQGAAAGCAVITSDTSAQRRALSDAACFVPAGDAGALATAIARLADDGDELDRLRRTAERLRAELDPEHAIEPLDDLLRSGRSRPT